MNSTDTHRDSQGRAAAALNWAGDIVALPYDQLRDREQNLSSFVCAMLAGTPNDKPNPAEAQRALALWVETRDQLLALGSARRAARA